MKVTFGVMPWHSLDFPCLASGILTSVAQKSFTDWQFHQIYSNIEWAEYLNTITAGAFSPDEYSLLGNDFVYCLAGEWVFSGSLHGTSKASIDDYYPHFVGSKEQFEFILEAYHAADTYISLLARRIADDGTNILALSSTFSQNVAALSLAKKIKQIKPKVITVLGGGNCDGIQGEALHRNFDFVDFVVRGEGETAFVDLLAEIEEEHPSYESVKSLCWWSDGQHVSNPQGKALEITDVPAPVYDPYFSTLEASYLQPHIQPSIVVENARGCWWGQKHHCTFCGLNGSSMSFRSKEQDQAVVQIETLIKRHHILDVIVTDNILDNAYFEEFLPRLAEHGWDLRMQYEIKANLKSDQIELMRQAGITHVQPGIESLSSNVLRLMRKGITGPRNIQALRDCQNGNITVSWNYLIGFPGETEADYTNIIDQLPHLYHLQPPRGGVTRISVQRFSPYYNDSELGFADRLPHPAYSIIYRLTPTEIDDLAFFHVSPPRGISLEQEEHFQQAISLWQDAHDGGALFTFETVGQGIVLTDTRAPRGPIRTELFDPIEVAMFDTLAQVIGKKGACAKVAKLTGASESTVAAVFDRFVACGIAFADDELAVRLPINPQKIGSIQGFWGLPEKSPLDFDPNSWRKDEAEFHVVQA